MAEPAERAVDRLLSGVATGDVETVRDGWRGVRALGPAVGPAIEARLDSAAWGQVPKGPAGRYLGALLAALSELDRERFAAALARLRAGGLHPLHARTVEIMARRLDERPLGRIGPGVAVHVADDLPGRRAILAEIAGWSETAGVAEALDRVSRIDVIGQATGMDYLGLYEFYVSGIVLAWPGLDFGPRWLRRLSREHTFYHELGHHACGHVEGGQVTEQEREADAFAAGLMRAAHPVLIPLGRVLLWPLRGWARRRRLRQERLTE
ncbi:MAG: hypothetical protein R3D85_07700 [Paracoccaceae bacterium]